MEKYEFYWKFFEQPKRRISRFINKLLKRDTNAKLIQKEADKFRGEIMLDDFNVIRLLGWTDQYEEDYYWVYLERIYGIGNRVRLLSCVGGFERLKNRLTKYQYYHLDHIWKLNGCSYEEGLALAELKRIYIK